MIFVDYREGSAALLKPLRAAGLPAEEADLAVDGGSSADVAWTGRGEGGVSVEVGLEFKQLSECVASIRTERLQGLQLPTMWKAYDFRYLLVEGALLFNQRGVLLRHAGKKGLRPMPGQMTVGEWLKRINVMHLCGGLNFLHTQNRKESVKYIEMLYRTWTDQDLDQHKSHLGVYNPPTPIPVSDFRQAVMRWPGVGFKMSAAVEKQFDGSIKRASLASVDTWAGIASVDKQGHQRRFGDKAAARVVAFLEGK